MDFRAFKDFQGCFVYRAYISFTTTWRIIPVSKWLITMVNKSPKDRLVPLQNDLSTPWLINGGDPFTTYDTWDDPPSRGPFWRW